jgi:chromosome segregation ATPase
MVVNIIYVTAGLICIFVLIAVLLQPPSKKTKPRKKRQNQKGPEEELEDWKTTSMKLEETLYALRRELVDAQKREQTLQRELTLQQEKYQKLQEKLHQERSWKDKEMAEMDRKTDAINVLQQDLKKIEEQLEEEHGSRLQAERESREQKQIIQEAKDARRSLEAQVAKANNQIDVLRQEIMELRAMNEKLSKKHDDTTWVAKTEYVKLKQELTEKEKELTRLKRRVEGEWR